MTDGPQASGGLVPQAGIMRIAPYVGGEGDGSGFRLSANENPFGAGAAAVAAYRACVHSLGVYPDGGATELRRAIAAAHGLEAAQVVCGSGSDELIGLLCHAYAGVGTEVIHSAHAFLMYRIYALATGAEPVAVPECDLTADVDGILRAVGATTRIVFLANPNNPTGSWLPEVELRRLAEGLPSHVLLVIDAAYAEYHTDVNYEPGSALVERHENVVMLRTFSKIHGLAGLRVGWAYCPLAVCDVLHRIRGPFNVSLPAQRAAAAAVQDEAHILRSVEENSRQRERLTTRLVRLGLVVPPSGGNFVLTRFASAAAATAADEALRERNIFVRRMAAYGLPDSLRITVGSDEAGDAVVDALSTHLQECAA